MCANMIINDCKFCGGQFKITTTEYTIRSRHSEKSETTIENLGVNECTICGHIELPESSEKYIEMIRQTIRREMESQGSDKRITAQNTSSDTTNDEPLANFKRFFKKLIG